MKSGVIAAANRIFILTERVFLDRVARTLFVDDQEETLSTQKFDLLCYLLDRPSAAVSAGDLVRHGVLRPSQAQRFKGLVQELRRHLGPARDLIRPVPGYGYRIDLGVDVSGRVPPLPSAVAAPDG
jgi:DNA-binding response OmpR family regulator